MSEPLATELLELIIDFVAGDTTQDRTGDLLSLCLTCKALVPCSQTHIFSDVVLYPPVRDRRPRPWKAPPEFLKRYEMTSSFLRTVSQRPRLASHVRALTCTFTAQWLDTDASICSTIPQAFEHMENVNSLTIVYQDPYKRDNWFDMSEPSVSLSEWTKGIKWMLQVRRVEKLTLRELSQYPGETILCSPHLQHLTLRNTKLQPVISSVNSTTPDLPQLQSLRCDWRSLREGLKFLLSELDATVDPPVMVDAGHGSLVSHVRTVDISPTLANQEETTSLLSQTACLQALTLRVQATAGYPMACPLDSLNPASFDTLSHLTLRIRVGVVGSGIELALPYGFEWRGILSQMHQLEKFNLHLEFEGYFNVLEGSFGDQWGEIPEVLADCNLMPQLKDVRLTINMKIIEYDDEATQVRSAEAFLGKIQTTVHPRWALSLEMRKGHGDFITFSYAAGITKSGTSWEFE